MSSGTILDKLIEATAARVHRDQSAVPFEEMRRRAEELCSNSPSTDSSESEGTGNSFYRALSRPGMSFICEVKKASPSKGVIAPDFPYLTIAQEYEAAGAAAISCLTETDYFLGKDEYLSEIARTVSIPVLRKDFTIDPYQIYQAKVLGASAVLLIAAILDTNQLSEYLRITESLGLGALVEAHDEEEAKSALRADASIIGVNNRNLKDFSVDLHNSIRLRAMIPRDKLFVSESGIRTREDIRVLSESGLDAVLIGETLMRSPDKKEALDELRC